MKTNLIDVWQHVGEAGGEDDAATEAGEAGEKPHRALPTASQIFY